MESPSNNKTETKHLNQPVSKYTRRLHNIRVGEGSAVGGGGLILRDNEPIRISAKLITQLDRIQIWTQLRQVGTAWSRLKATPPLPTNGIICLMTVAISWQ